jgi:protein-S-isoprenylcysteine O-methyltransferase Ste14
METVDPDDTPGVVAPPPLIFLAFLAAGLALDRVWPASFEARIASGVLYAAAVSLIAGGVAVVASARRRFIQANTHIEPWKPTRALVTGGLFRYSRNPIYIAVSAIHAGISLAADSPWALAFLVPALVVIRYGVIAREERYLEARFGDEYRRYRATVRRWL